MNERIREMMDKANQHAVSKYHELNHGLESTPRVLEIFSEKFAELIVQECMDVANTYQNRGGNCYVDDMIAKHFGVEE